jgi:hypothetical protein
MTDERCQEESCLFLGGHYTNRGYTQKKLFWVRFHAKLLSAAQKLSTIEERGQKQSCLLRRRNYRNKGYTQKIPGSNPGKDNF